MKKLKIQDYKHYKDPVNLIIGNDRQINVKHRKNRSIADILLEQFASVYFEYGKIRLDLGEFKEKYKDDFLEVIGVDSLEFNYEYNDRAEIINSSVALYDPKTDLFLLFESLTDISFPSSDLSSTEKEDTTRGNGKKMPFTLTNIAYYNLDTTKDRLRDVDAITRYFIKEYCNKPEPSASVLIKTFNGLEIKSSKIKPETIDFEHMYNDDFVPISEHIVDKLTNTSKGLVLLHGIPGSGKTNYIKWLTGVIPNKRFIFIPMSMLESLSGPDLVKLLLDIQQDKILILEDCEKYIYDRTASTDNNAISTILNLSDGIMSDILSCQFICTFNADISTIDTALLRKGRLIAEYEFRELSKEKANAYLESIGKSPDIEEPVSLADLISKDEPQMVSSDSAINAGKYSRGTSRRIGFVRS